MSAEIEIAKALNHIADNISYLANSIIIAGICIGGMISASKR